MWFLISRLGASASPRVPLVCDPGTSVVMVIEGEAGGLSRDEENMKQGSSERVTVGVEKREEGWS